MELRARSSVGLEHLPSKQRVAGSNPAGRASPSRSSGPTSGNPAVPGATYDITATWVDTIAQDDLQDFANRPWTRPSYLACMQASNVLRRFPLLAMRISVTQSRRAEENSAE